MSLLGTKIKPFRNKAFRNGKFLEITEKEIFGKWNIFFFYPADFTFVCPTELEDLAENYDDFKALSVEIYSVSTDTHFSHKVWFDISKTISKIRYTMIGDPNGLLTRNFEIMQEETGLSSRGTFIIDPSGIIRSIEIVSDNIGRSSTELIRKIRAMRNIEKFPEKVCPARWNDGKSMITPSIELVGKL